jgi:hypothetical protein
MYNGDSSLDDDALQISAFFYASVPGAPNISYAATMASPKLTIGNITGSLPVQVGDPAVIQIVTF